MDQCLRTAPAAVGPWGAGRNEAADLGRDPVPAAPFGLDPDQAGPVPPLPVGVAGRPAAAELDASVALSDRVRIVVGVPGKAPGPFQVPRILQALVEALVVGPHAQHAVGALLPDPARNLLPAGHGVEGHDAAPGTGMRSSSGMAVISLDLLSTAVRAGTRRLASAQAPVVGAAHALAGNGHHLPPGPFEGRLHPVPEALLETGRVQPCEDPPQRVVRGDPVRQARSP